MDWGRRHGNAALPGNRMSPGPKRRPAGGKGPDVDAVVPRTWTPGQAQTGQTLARSHGFWVAGLALDPIMWLSSAP